MNNSNFSTKPKWQKPILLVIIRNHPEETVLATCKNSSSSSSMGGIYGNCKWSFDLGICLKCNSIGGS